MDLHKGQLVCAYKANAILGEGPVWSPKENVLYWVDILGKKLHRFDPAVSKDYILQMPESLTSVALRETGGLIGTFIKKIVGIDPKTGSYKEIAKIEPREQENRFNDAKCDRQGRFLAGTMNCHHLEKPHGSLYRIDPDHSVHCLQKEIACSNGLGWNPEGTVFYFTETHRHSIYSYHYDINNGSINDKKVFVQIDPKSGAFPDGLTVDRAGSVWGALYGIGQIVRYSPKGKIEFVLQLPVPRVTSCAFGGKELDILFITTATEGMTEEEIHLSPLSGSLFAFKPGVKGIPETPFKG
jgi:sugar lactone lactonase YvrE